MAKRILVIDDDQWFADVVGRQLKDANYEIEYANDGVAAMKRIDRHPPHVIILDLFMPGPDGLALLHELQSYSDLASVPVILCSNSIPSVPLKTLVPYGIVAVLDKTTMTPNDVVAATRRALW